MSYITYICAGAVVFVPDTLSADEAQDGLDALLYCQTVASGRIPEFANFERWMNANVVAIRTLGGMVFGEPYFNAPGPMSGSFSLAELLSPTLTLLTSTSIEGLQASLAKASLYPSVSPEWALLHAHTVQAQRWVRFKLAVMSPEGSMRVAAIAFEFDEVVTGHILSHRFAHDKVIGNVSISAYKAQMETEDYDLSRATVISLLGCQREEQVIRLT